MHFGGVKHFIVVTVCQVGNLYCSDVHQVGHYVVADE